MYQSHSNTDLPTVFNDFFSPVSKRHKCNTRLASQSSFCLSKIRTNYGKFNIRFNDPKIWNELPETIKSNSQSKKIFKTQLIAHLIESY